MKSELQAQIEEKRRRREREKQDRLEEERLEEERIQREMEALKARFQKEKESEQGNKQ